MTEQFVNGHAVIIGVGADLPTTVDDAVGLADILRDQERCAYPPEQVRLLTGERATRTKVLTALDELIATAADDATVMIYYSGHGYEVGTPIGKWYFLMPHGYDLNDLPGTAIRGDELAERIRALRARKILLLLDCCHAGGFDPAKAPGVQLTKAPMPAEAQELLSRGRGLVLVASSRESEKSFAGKPYSAFTLALVEALAGQGTSRQDGYARVADLALYTGKTVPSRTGDRQHPILNFEQADNFAVAYYAAGDSATKGLPFDVEPEIETDPGALNRATLDQRSQTVHGPQTNIAGGILHGPVLSGAFSAPVEFGSRRVDTGGAAYVGGNVATGGGKFVGRDDHSATITQQVASLEELRKLVAELGRLLRQANLTGDVAEVIDADFKVIEQQAAKEAPSGVVVKSKLSSVMEALKNAAGAARHVDKIVSLGSKLAKVAMALVP
jgi:hypothetical protein